MLPVTALDSVSIPARSWPAPDRVNVSDDDDEAMASLDDRVGTCRRDASGKIVIFPLSLCLNFLRDLSRAGADCGGASDLER